MTIEHQFPEFDIATLPPIPSTWIDLSWRNDVCPSWAIGKLRIWVDFADPKERDFEHGCRFRITDEEVSEIIFESNDWSEVLNFVFLSNLELPEIPEDEDEEGLTKVYDEFLAITSLPAMSADELSFEVNVPKIINWLGRFIKAWEQMEEDEENWIKYASQKAGI